LRLQICEICATSHDWKFLVGKAEALEDAFVDLVHLAQCVLDGDGASVIGPGEVEQLRTCLNGNESKAVGGDAAKAEIPTNIGP
jgi:hypothetical protein